MTRRKPRLPNLGELELDVLELLWRNGPADVAAAHASVGKPRGISLNTVGSALERLYKKGLARRHKVSHAFRYEPALTAEQFAAQRVLDAAGSLRELSDAGLLSAFVDLVADVDERALDRLESLIAEKRQDKGGA